MGRWGVSPLLCFSMHTSTWHLRFICQVPDFSGNPYPYFHYTLTYAVFANQTDVTPFCGDEGTFHAAKDILAQSQLTLNVSPIFFIFPSCETSDSLMAYVSTNGQKDRIGDFCGTETPPRIMSNGHRLTLEFKSLGHNVLKRPSRRPSLPPKSSSSSHSHPSFTSHQGKTRQTNQRHKSVTVHSENDEDEDDDTSEETNREKGAKTKSTNVTASKQKPLAKGFKATYRFVTSKSSALIFCITFPAFPQSNLNSQGQLNAQWLLREPFANRVKVHLQRKEKEKVNSLLSWNVREGSLVVLKPPAGL